MIKEPCTLKEIDSYSLGEEIRRTIRFWGFEYDNFKNLINYHQGNKLISWGYSFKDKYFIAYNYLENSFFRWDLKTEEEVLKFLKNLKTKADEKDYSNN